MVTTVLIALYFALLAVLAFYGAHRLSLVHRALRPSSAPSEVAPPSQWPSIVVQLPVYNEAFVVERLLRAVAALEYPRDQLTIQVLDDSRDPTTRIIARVVSELSKQGVPIEHLRRPDRTGYKAGALAFGLERSDAELVAIFDADFVPAPKTLERLVARLCSDPACALAQARWAYLNRDRSLLTRAQAIFLDGHFSIEQYGRNRGGQFFNFNGTAGVWRRAAIEQAGGWSWDTITEDLDLSYRAQMAGWRFAYIDDVACPSELPESWSAFRTQQARWVRGSLETARKHLSSLLGRKDLPVATRLEAFVHLTNNVAYLLMAALAVLLPLAVVVRDQLGWRVPAGQSVLSLLDLTMLTAGTLAVTLFYLAAEARLGGARGAIWRIPDILYALCLGAGMSLSNALEVLRGLRSDDSVFVRTPKRGAAVVSDGALVKYRSQSRWGMVGLEILAAAYFLSASVYSMQRGLFAALPFLISLSRGLFECSRGRGSRDDRALRVCAAGARGCRVSRLTARLDAASEGLTVLPDDGLAPRA